MPGVGTIPSHLSGVGVECRQRRLVYENLRGHTRAITFIEGEDQKKAPAGETPKQNPIRDCWIKGNVFGNMHFPPPLVNAFHNPPPFGCGQATFRSFLRNVLSAALRSEDAA